MPTGYTEDELWGTGKKSFTEDELWGKNPQTPNVQRPVGAPTDFMSSVTPPEKSFEEETREAWKKKKWEDSLPGTVVEPLKRFIGRQAKIEALPFDQKLKVRAGQLGEGFRDYMETPARTAIQVAGAVGGLPTLFMKPKKAKAYLKGMEETTGLSPMNNAIAEQTALRVQDDPNLQDAATTGSTVGDVATMGATSKAKLASTALFALPALGAVEQMGAEKDADIYKKILAAGGVSLLAKLMGAQPASRVIEGITKVGGSPRLAAGLAVPLAGAEGGTLVALQNAIMKGTINPEQKISEGTLHGASLGAGMRLGMGHLGTGGVELKNPEPIYKLSEVRKVLDATSTGKMGYNVVVDPTTSHELAQNPVMAMAQEMQPNVPQQGVQMRLETAPYPRAVGQVEAPGPRLEQGFLDTRREAINPTLEGTLSKIRELEAKIKNSPIGGNRRDRRNLELLKQSAEAMSSDTYARNRPVDFGAEPIPENPAPALRTPQPTPGATVLRPWEQGNRLMVGSGSGQPEAPVRINNGYTAEGTMFGENPNWDFTGTGLRPDQAAERAVWANRSAGLADSMGFTQGAAAGPWAEIPMASRDLAYRYYEVSRQVHQAPNNPEFKANLEAIVKSAQADPNAQKAIAILKNAKAENFAAAQEAAPHKDMAPGTVEQWSLEDPHYIPRKVTFTEAKGDMPAFIKDGILTPDAFKQRKIKWLINEATGEKQLIHSDNAPTTLPEGFKIVDATRAEIQKGTNITYLDDPLVALGRSTAQMRSVKRVGQIKAFVDEQAAQGNAKPKQIFDDAFNNKDHRDPTAIDNFNRTVTNVGFLNPFVHAPNQMSHFIKQLGARDLLGAGDNAGELVTAMHEMSTYSPEFRNFLLHGGQSMRRQSYWKDLKGKMNDLLQTPDVQNELKKEFGNGNKFDNFIQEVTSMPTWLLDDAMRFSLAKKAAAKNGGNWQKAIQDVDQSFPDYRLHTFATGGEGKAADMTNKAYNLLFKGSESKSGAVRALAPLFMKYRFGQWKSFMNMWGESAKAVGSGDVAKMAQMGDKMGAVFFTKLVLLPALSGVYNATFGDEEKGLKIKARPGGHQHAMDQLEELYDAGKASWDTGSAEPLSRQARKSAQQFAIMNPLVRLGTAAAGYDMYNNKAVPADQRTQSLMGNLPFGREAVAFKEFGQPMSQVLAGALVGKVDKTPLERYVSTAKSEQSFVTTPSRRETMKTKRDLQNAIMDGDQEKTDALVKALGGEGNKDVQDAFKFAAMGPEQRLMERMKNLTPVDLTGSFMVAKTDDEKNLVRAIIHKRLQTGKINEDNRSYLTKWVLRHGGPPPQKWIDARPWLKGLTGENEPDET